MTLLLCIETISKGTQSNQTLLPKIKAGLTEINNVIAGLGVLTQRTMKMLIVDLKKKTKNKNNTSSGSYVHVHIS